MQTVYTSIPDRQLAECHSDSRRVGTKPQCRRMGLKSCSRLQKENPTRAEHIKATTVTTSHKAVVRTCSAQPQTYMLSLSFSLLLSPSSSKIRVILVCWGEGGSWSDRRPVWPITGAVLFLWTPSDTQRVEDKNKPCIVSINHSLQVAFGEIIWTWQEFDFFEESSWYKKRHVFSYFHYTIIPHAASHTLLASKPKHLNSPGSLVYKPLDAVWWSISQRWQQREGI